MLDRLKSYLNMPISLLPQSMLQIHVFGKSWSACYASADNLLSLEKLPLLSLSMLFQG